MSTKMKELMAEIGNDIDREYHHFLVPLASIAKIVDLPAHQRETIVNKEKELDWISDMLIMGILRVKQSSKIMPLNAARAFGIDKKASIAGNYQRFGIWNNTGYKTNEYPRYAIEEGAHRCVYYTDFVDNGLKINENIVNRKSKYDGEILKKLFKVCNSDFINYEVLKDMGLTSLIDDLEIQVDMITTSNPEIASQMFRSFNNAVAVKGSDLRKNLYVDYYLYDLIDNFFDNFSKCDSFVFNGVNYTSQMTEALRFVLPNTKGSKGKYFDILCRCMLINRSLTDGYNWTKNTVKQDGVAHNLFSRYCTDRRHTDADTLTDFHDTMKKIAFLGEILLTSKKKPESQMLFDITAKNGNNYVKGAASLHSAFINAYNDISILYPSATINDYVNILETFSNALVNGDNTYTHGKMSVKIVKQSPYKYTTQKHISDVLVNIAKALLVR